MVVPISISEFAGKYMKGRTWQQRSIVFFLSLADWEEKFNDPDLDSSSSETLSAFLMLYFPHYLFVT